MMIDTRSFWRAASLALTLLVLSGCGARQENLAILPADELYNRGVAAMEAGDHEEAITMLEFFTNQHIGDPRVPQARMMLGDASMARREYATAAAHYMRLVNDYPAHELGLEARFRTCEAYYQLSPDTPLDQEYTRSALAHCQSVADYFPDTPQATQSAARVAELRDKLAEKLYAAGVHYFRRRAYDAAVVYFTEVVEQFPNTNVAPKALERLVETYTRIGYVEDAAATRERLQREYPESPQAQALRS